MPSYQTQNSQQNNHSSSSSSTEQEVDEMQELYGNSVVQDMMEEEQQSHHPASLSSPYDAVYLKHVLQVSSIQIGLSTSQLQDMETFISHWHQHRSRYENVSRKTNMPAKLIAALHWRESTGNFNTYLHQGDPLGRPPVNWPTNIPTFHNWEDAAVHALNQKKSLQNQLEMSADTTNAASIATYAEGYNGLGYHYRNTPSPYVYSGSNQYSSGKYVSDGQFSSSTVDRQMGVIPMVGALQGLNTTQDMTPKAVDASFVWSKVLSGQLLLKQGTNGPEVELLQQKLQQAGYSVTVDGDFGPGTARAVREFQEDHQHFGLSVDGIVGKGTATQLENSPTQQSSSSSSGDNSIE